MQDGLLIESYEEIDKKIDLEFSSALTNEGLVAKIQILSGGRGKTGGVKICKSIDEIKDFTSKFLNKNVVTYQSSAKGEKVKCIYLERAVNIKQELYLSLVLDVKNECISILCSSEGGVDIESNIDSIGLVKINTDIGLQDFHIIQVLKFMKLDFSKFSEISNIVRALYDIVYKKDAILVEINPLVLDSYNKLVVIDTKMNFDENSLYRQEGLPKNDLELTEQELKAKNSNLNYINLEGNIGCMVNGAGLGMATIDLISSCGKKPANFLDLGGSVGKDQIEVGIDILSSSKNIDQIFINIFGGIVKCDMIAEEIIKSSSKIKVPIIVRLEGNNSELAKDMLSSSGMKNLFFANSLQEAANLLKKL